MVGINVLAASDDYGVNLRVIVSLLFLDCAGDVAFAGDEEGR